MAEQLDPTAAWSRHLQEPWSDCTARGEVDGRNPPTTLVEAYLQVAEARVRRLVSIPWGDGTHDLGVDEESLFADLTPTRAHVRDVWGEPPGTVLQVEAGWPDAVRGLFCAAGGAGAGERRLSEGK